MSITRAVLRFAAPPPKLEDYQRYLFLGPHPDDIEIGAGATAAKLAAQGKAIRFVVCTDGRFGLTNAPAGTSPEELIPLRREEAKHSAALLGVEDLRFLPFSDGGLYDCGELLHAVAGEIADFRPDVIFAPDPDVDSECHRDHRNVGEIARQLACFSPYEELMRGYGVSGAPVQALAYYMTARPNRYVKTAGYFQRQLDSVFLCHVSQFPTGSPDARSIRLYLKLRSANFGLRCLCPAAEGFRVLGQTQMHCLPEAGL